MHTKFNLNQENQSKAKNLRSRWQLLVSFRPRRSRFAEPAAQKKRRGGDRHGEEMLATAKATQIWLRERKKFREREADLNL